MKKIKNIFLTVLCLLSMSACKPTTDNTEKRIDVQSLTTNVTERESTTVTKHLLKSKTESGVVSDELQLTNVALIYPEDEQIKVTVTLDNPYYLSINQLKFESTDDTIEFWSDTGNGTMEYVKLTDLDNVVAWNSSNVKMRTFIFRSSSADAIETLSITDILVTGESKWEGQELTHNTLTVYKITTSLYNFTTVDYAVDSYYTFKVAQYLPDFIQNFKINNEEVENYHQYTMTTSSTYVVTYDFVVANEVIMSTETTVQFDLPQLVKTMYAGEGGLSVDGNGKLISFGYKVEGVVEVDESNMQLYYDGIALSRYAYRDFDGMYNFNINISSVDASLFKLKIANKMYKLELTKISEKALDNVVYQLNYDVSSLIEIR